MSKKRSAVDTATDITAEAALVATRLVAEATERARIVAATAVSTAADLAPKLALAIADQSRHEAVCVERYTGIKDDLKFIKRLIAWAGGTIIMTMLACIGWFIATGGLTRAH